MRLEKIKLSGFKTFVEPTTIPLPVNLVGIVGPNGCGKSNIIDAVRWVMGESSAKNLRGGSMADVIFNGSSSRKPIGKASVELVFDNDDGAIGGEYSKYSQLSIKRQVTRDGQSSYFLNSSKCRRRDITDIFLGTGLGPRSYAIIEQGMISRLIEAKPEDLRIFLEEAAGVSKYKERRHETEIRMRHTRENLERLNDLKEELQKQIEKLKRQAKIAERYKRLKADERCYKRELLALRWQSFDQQFQLKKLETARNQTALEKVITDQQQLDSSTDKARDHFKSCQTNVNRAQAGFYEIGSEIAHIEQSIRHAKTLQKQTELELSRAKEEQSNCLKALENDKQRIAELGKQQKQLALEQNGTAENERLALDQHNEAAKQTNLWQIEWEQFISQESEPKEQLKTQQARLHFLERQQQQLLKRGQRLQAEFAQLKEANEQVTLDSNQTEIDQLDKEAAQLLRELDSLDQAVTEARELNQQLNREINHSRTELHAVKGKISALEKIIEHATGRDRSELMDWLTEQGLNESPRLLEQLEVESKWEAALEVVLSEFLDAACIESSQPFHDKFESLSDEGLALIERSGTSVLETTTGERLLDKVKSPWPLDGLLGTVFCAEDISEAYQRINQLKSHESVITNDGIWLGHGWLLKDNPKEAKSGLLQKEKELKQLRKDEGKLVTALDLKNSSLEASLSRLKEAEQKLSSVRSKHNQNLSLLASKKSRQAGLLARFEQNSERKGKLGQELEEISLEEKKISEEQKISRSLIEAAELKIATLDSKRASLADQGNELKSKQAQSDQNARALRESLHTLTSRLNSIKADLRFCEKNAERSELQLVQIEKRIADIKQPDGETELSTAKLESEHRIKMQKKAVIEESLQKARRELSAVENQIRENSEKRSLLESDIDRNRTILEDSRISQEGMAVHREAALEQLKEQGAVLQEVIDSLEEGANEQEWQAQIEQLAQKIERLGTINLAAIEEHEALSERMSYLDEQHRDLTESLTMLEQAISKIDRETKALFKETFEKVNNGFKERFPKLFGGGRAYLSLDDQDLLSTGVSVMASPPGKRNSSIHLLSGGEKALTAVALVFSIFDLNPAPFCLLDEVDAPLDDANVTRFSDLVKEMSSNVQFLFISHNKATMEIAQHLAGVTMSEPGISRMVSVDIDEAVKLSEL